MSKKQIAKETKLVDRFVASFENLDEMIAYDTDPVAQQLAIGKPDDYGFRKWRPSRVSTEPVNA